MEKMNSIIVALIIAVTLIVLLFVSLTRVDRLLDIKAIEVCSHASNYSKNVKSESFTASYPIEDLFNKCISATK